MPVRRRLSAVTTRASGGQGADAVLPMRDRGGPLMYAKQFFDLRLEFAERVSALSGVLRTRRIGLHEFLHPVWLRP